MREIGCVRTLLVDDYRTHRNQFSLWKSLGQDGSTTIKNLRQLLSNPKKEFDLMEIRTKIHRKNNE